VRGSNSPNLLISGFCHPKIDISFAERLTLSSIFLTSAVKRYHIDPQRRQHDDLMSYDLISLNG